MAALTKGWLILGSNQLYLWLRAEDAKNSLCCHSRRTIHHRRWGVRCLKPPLASRRHLIDRTFETTSDSFQDGGLWSKLLFWFETVYEMYKWYLLKLTVYVKKKQTNKQTTQQAAGTFPLYRITDFPKVTFPSYGSYTLFMSLPSPLAQHFYKTDGGEITSRDCALVFGGYIFLT